MTNDTGCRAHNNHGIFKHTIMSLLWSLVRGCMKSLLQVWLDSHEFSLTPCAHSNSKWNNKSQIDQHSFHTYLISPNRGYKRNSLFHADQPPHDTCTNEPIDNPMTLTCIYMSSNDKEMCFGLLPDCTPHNITGKLDGMFN